MNQEQINELRQLHQPDSKGICCITCVRLIPNGKPIDGAGLAFPSIFPCVVSKLLDALEEATVNA